MKKLLGVAIASLVAALSLLAGTAPHADASLAVRRFVLSTSCQTQFGDGGMAVPQEPAPNAWFLIPQRDEAAQRAAENGGPGVEPDQIWIDLSLFDNGFADGTYIGAGPFLNPVTGTSSFIWQNLLPGRLHYYRLNALVGDRWFQLGSASFETPDCNVVGALSCNSSPPSPSVSFVVPPVAPSDRGTVATQQWFDLSLFDNRFAPGLFLGTGPVPLSGASFRWTGILPASRHYFRVNTDFGAEGWRALAAGSFLSLNCYGLPENISLPL